MRTLIADDTAPLIIPRREPALRPLSRAQRAQVEQVRRRIAKTQARLAAAEADAAQPKSGYRCTCHRLYPTPAERAACKARQHREA